MPEHLELIKPRAPPLEHPPLASKHHPPLRKKPETVNSPEGKAGACSMQEELGIKCTKRKWDGEKKILLGKNEPKLFQNVSFRLQPHAWR